MSGDKKCRVLITGAGGAGTIEVLRSLRKTGRYELISADAGAHSYGFALSDRSYRIPLGADDGFSDAFASILERERPHFVIPLVDEEIPKVHALLARAGRDAPQVLAPHPEFCETALDKWATARTLAHAGLSHAHSALASELLEDFPFPAIVKPRSGRGSRGFAVVETREQLQTYLDASPLPASAFVVQERCTGREFTTSVVVGLDNTLLAIVPKEAVEKRGITVVGVTRQEPAIDALCKGIAQQLRPHGPFNVQLMLGEDGVPRVFEINPRYSTTVALTLAAGIDEVDAVMRHALGEEPGPLEFQPNFMMLRYSTQVYLPEEEWRQRYKDERLETTTESNAT